MGLRLFRNLEEVTLLLWVACCAKEQSAVAVSHLCSCGGLAAASLASEARNPCASAELWHARTAVAASAMISARGSDLV
jgi:hypothetical protein